MRNNLLKIYNLIIARLYAAYTYIKNSYIQKSEDKKCIYEFVECYKNDQGKQIVVAKVIDSFGRIFKLPATELVMRRRDILSGFGVDDIVNIVGLAATEKEPIVTQKKPTSYKYFALLAMLFGAALITSNIASSKLISVFGLTMTGGTLPYPLSYIFGDIITEVYGYKRTRQLIWGAITCNLFLVFFIELTIFAPPSGYWHDQHAYALILGSVPRIVIASLISYWAGEFLNSYVIARMKIAYNGQSLWIRIISSSLIGITVDTMLFVVIAYAGIMPFEKMIPFSIRVYAFKVFSELVAIPLTMWIINRIKVKETLDIFDINTKFTPFSLDVEYTDSNNRIAFSEEDPHPNDAPRPYHPGKLAK